MTGGADVVWRIAASECGQVMMVVGLPMPGRMVRGEPSQERWQTSTTRTITLIILVVVVSELGLG
jgi:hypothetical protein